MPHHGLSHGGSIIVIAALILFVIYRRVRRTIGFQKFVKRQVMTRMIIFAAIGVLLVAAGYTHPEIYLWDLVGVVIGSVIAYISMRTTTFERRGNNWFYRPHPWIGVLLLVLLVGRIVYRLYVDYRLFDTTHANAHAEQTQMSAYANDPLTVTIFFTLISYYVIYFIFLLRREGHMDNRQLDSDEFNR